MDEVNKRDLQKGILRNSSQNRMKQPKIGANTGVGLKPKRYTPFEPAKIGKEDQSILDAYGINTTLGAVKPRTGSAAAVVVQKGKLGADGSVYNQDILSTNSS